MSEVRYARDSLGRPQVGQSQDEPTGVSPHRPVAELDRAHRVDRALTLAGDLAPYPKGLPDGRRLPVPDVEPGGDQPLPPQSAGARHGLVQEGGDHPSVQYTGKTLLMLQGNEVRHDPIALPAEQHLEPAFGSVA